MKYLLMLAVLGAYSPAMANQRPLVNKPDAISCGAMADDHSTQVDHSNSTGNGNNEGSNGNDKKKQG